MKNDFIWHLYDQSTFCVSILLSVGDGGEYLLFSFNKLENWGRQDFDIAYDCRIWF